MSDPPPTPTRLALLRDVAGSDVPTRVWLDVHGNSWTRWYGARDNVLASKVTARANELREAGWIRINPDDDGQPEQDYELTDAGREVLAQHDKEG
jgi:hypothetical protein